MQKNWYDWVLFPYGILHFSETCMTFPQLATPLLLMKNREDIHADP